MESTAEGESRVCKAPQRGQRATRSAWALGGENVWLLESSVPGESVLEAGGSRGKCGKMSILSGLIQEPLCRAGWPIRGQLSGKPQALRAAEAPECGIRLCCRAVGRSLLSLVFRLQEQGLND